MSEEVLGVDEDLIDPIDPIPPVFTTTVKIYGANSLIDVPTGALSTDLIEFFNVSDVTRFGQVYWDTTGDIRLLTAKGNIHVHARGTANNGTIALHNDLAVGDASDHTIGTIRGLANPAVSRPSLGLGSDTYFVSGRDFIGANPATSGLADNFLHFGVAGTDKFKVDIAGNVTGGLGTFSSLSTGSAIMAGTLTVAAVNAVNITVSGILTIPSLITGVISGGTQWQAVPVGATWGGTGQSSYSIGDMLYATASDTLSKLTVGSANLVLTSSGSIPQWSSSLSGLASVSATSLSGTLTTAGNLTMSATASRLIPGATSFSVRNNANGSDNLLILDSGAITVRSSISGVTTLTATTVGGTLSTAAQPNITSMASLAVVGTIGTGVWQGTPVAASFIGAHTHIPSDITGLLDGGGHISASLIPALAITNTFVVNSQVAMLALSSAETGDLAVRTDLSKTFILTTTPFSTLGNWQELLTPTDSVLSVNGFTGVVSLTFTDVGAAALVHTHAATDIVSGTLSNARTTATSANTASAIVARDGSGDFSAHAITAAFIGDGSALTNLNAASLASGSISPTVGGTGQTSVTTGDLLYGSSANTWSRLAGNTATTREFLLSTGTGSAGQAPGWATLLASDIPSLNASVITAGTLSASVGGTGNSTYAVGDLIYAAGTTALSRLSGNAAIAKRFLTQAGNATTPNAPQWWSLIADDVGAGTFTGAFTFANGLSFSNSIISTMGSLLIGSVPMFTGTATWNNAGQVFVNNFVNILDTASDANSLLVDWQVSSSSKWKIDKTGTVKTGIWQGSVVGSTWGGTGVNNGSSTITLGGSVLTAGVLTTAGSLITSGAFSLTLTTTASTNVTLPTSGTLVNTAVTTLSSLSSVNGQTISSAANFTGSLTVGSALAANTGRFAGTVSMWGRAAIEWYHDSGVTGLWFAGPGASDGSDDLQFYSISGSAVRLKIADSGGLVTIANGLTISSGTTTAQVISATGSISINGGSSIELDYVRTGTGAGTKWRTGFGIASGANDDYLIYDSVAGAAAFTLTSNTGAATFAGAVSGISTLQTSGNVGLGDTPDGTYRLYIKSSAVLKFHNADSGFTLSQAGSNNWSITQVTGGSTFSINSDNITLSGVTTASGNLTVGTNKFTVTATTGAFTAGAFTSTTGNNTAIIASPVFATTGYIALADIQNTSGRFTLGVESSTGGSITTGTAAYASVVSSFTELDLASGNIVRLSISTAGAFDFKSNPLSGIAALTASGLITASAGLTIASGQTLTVSGVTVTGLTAASVGAGTFPSGAFVFPTSVSTPIVTSAVGADLVLKTGTAGTVATFASASGNLTFGGISVAGITTLALTSTFTTTKTLIAIQGSGAATARQSIDFTNTSGNMTLGIEGSAGGQLLVGATAYATVLGTSTATNLQLGANNNVYVTINGTTTTLSSTTTAVQALTATGATIGTATGNTLGAGSLDLHADIGMNTTQGIIIGSSRVVAFSSGATSITTTGAGVFGGKVTVNDTGNTTVAGIQLGGAGNGLSLPVANTVNLVVNGATVFSSTSSLMTYTAPILSNSFFSVAVSQKIYLDGATAIWIINNSAGRMSFAAGSAEVMRIDAGVGLTVTGAVSASSFIRNDTLASGFAIGALASVQRISWDGTAFNFLNASNANAPLIAAGATFSGQYNGTRFAGSVAVDWNNGNVQSLTLVTGANTVTEANPKDGARYLLLVKQPSSGAAGTVTWPASFDWGGAGTPILSAVNSQVDMISLVYRSDDTKYYATGAYSF